MIIKIEFELDEIKNIPHMDYRLELLIDRMSKIIRTGNHLIIGTPLFFRNMSKRYSDNDPKNKIFEAHSRRMTFDYNKHNDTYTINLTYNTEDEFITGTNERKNINIKHFLDGTKDPEYYLGDSVIVFENCNERHIYKFFFNFIAKVNSKNSYLGYRVANGNGRNTDEVCKLELESTFNVFCICDSDVKYPGAPQGDTSNKIVNEYQKHPLKKNCYYVLDAHEIENLLPINLYEKHANQSQRDAVNFVKYLSETEIDAYYYYDFKKSHGFKDIFEKNDRMATFWRNLYCGFKDNEIHIEAAKNKATAKNKDNRILNSLETLAGVVKEQMATDQNLITQLELKPPHLYNQWEKIANKLEAWLIASPPIRI